MASPQPTADHDLNAVLSALVAGAQAALGAGFVGAYLQGSFALGAWDLDSDVDFLVVTVAGPSDEEAARLGAMHARLYDRSEAWAKHLEGSYIPRARLGTSAPLREPLLFLDNGAQHLERSSHCDTFVVRWVTRECGITLVGPSPETLIAPVTPDDLRREVRAKMHAWREETATHPEWLANRWGQAYAVLQFCRMLHTLATGQVGSKLAGVRWAQATLAPRWAGLMQRAWDDRPDPAAKVRLPAAPEAIAQTIAFMDEALALSGDGA